MRKMKPASFLRPLSWGCAVLFAAGACSSDKNHAERALAQSSPPPDYAKYDNITGGEDTMVQFPVGDGCGMGAPASCIQDPGSTTTVEELAEMQKDTEFAWMWPDAGPGLATYTYDDNTTRFHVPTMVKSMASDLPGGWEPKFYDASFLGVGPALSARFKGGPFTEYGGGFGQSFRTITAGSTHPPLEAALSQEFPGDANGANGAYDLSGWTGLAVYVRRGPTGQSTMRIGITERNSAEDLNSGALNIPEPVPGIVEGKYCKRWRLCGCSGGTPCSLYETGADGVGIYRCFDPAYGRPPAGFDPLDYPTCGTTRCNEPNVSTFVPGSTGPDPLFNGKSCSQAVQSDGRSDWFCYNPGSDPTPPAKRERCNNPYSRAFTVTTDWQIIKIPFTDLRQADEADVANDMDLKSVKQIAITYGAGWLDFWVANLGFYRSTKQ